MTSKSSTAGSGDLSLTPSRDISRLLEIMAALRSPETGCPWDVEQTFETIAPYTIEEAYEVSDAISRNEMNDLCDELGDLLLQVVFHSRIAEEKGAFKFDDVVEAITTKMIRRHPHVFGNGSAPSADMSKATWERIKEEERAERNRRRESNLDAAPMHLDNVPSNFPALTHAFKLQHRASKVGFDWKDERPILDKIDEEMSEFREAVASKDRVSMKNEFGDVLFSLVNYGRHLGLDAEVALQGTNRKFRTRFDQVETALRNAGRELDDADLAEMEALWQSAKKAER